MSYLSIVTTLLRIHGKSRQKIAGLSLIELLLVITVLATISVVGINQLARSAENQKIETTVQQFQSLMLNARNYYQSRATWPDLANLTDFYNFAPGTQYMVNNPWGIPYKIIDSTFQESVSPQTMSTTVPTLRAAKLIAARLPFAILPNNASSPYLITVYMTIPWVYTVQTNTLPKIWDMGVKQGVTSSQNTDIPVPTQPQCGPGYKPDWIAGFNYFKNTADDKAKIGTEIDLGFWIGGPYNNNTRWFNSVYLCGMANPSKTCTFLQGARSMAAPGSNQVQILAGWGNMGGTGTTNWTGSSSSLYSDNPFTGPIPELTADIMYMTYCAPFP